MTSNHDRIQAVTELGFTERQARFLVLVMRHAGVCVPRQYARFAGVAYGAKCNAFFDRLVRRGFARPSECIHNRARLYHLHSKSLYHVIGEARSRHRRSISPRLAIERLMLLDAALTTPDLEWLTTTSQKSDYLAKMTASAHALVEDAASSERESKATADLPGAFPIGVEPNGRTVLLYVATEASTDAFRSFLQAHVALLRVAANWTLRIVFPRPLDLLYDAYQTVVHDELESPLHSTTIGELKWYFENLDQATREPVHPQTQAFLNVGDRVFRARRFTETRTFCGRCPHPTAPPAARSDDQLGYRHVEESGRQHREHARTERADGRSDHQDSCLRDRADYARARPSYADAQGSAAPGAPMAWAAPSSCFRAPAVDCIACAPARRDHAFHDSAMSS